jgi:hypothetical protein
MVMNEIDKANGVETPLAKGGDRTAETSKEGMCKPQT